MITITGIIILLIMEMLATKPAFLQNSKAAKMFKAKVLPTYCSHKVDPINGPGAQEYRVSQKTHFQNALGALAQSQVVGTPCV